MIGAAAFRTNSGAAAGTGGGISMALVTVAGTFTSMQVLQRLVHRLEVLLHDGLAALP